MTRRKRKSDLPAAQLLALEQGLAQPGIVFADRYRLEERIGAGGMSSIWIARDVVSDDHVAVKVMTVGESVRQDQIERFRREAEVAKRLRGPHFVTVFDYGEQDGLPFIVMQLLKGENLQARLARKGKMSVREALALLGEISHGLGVAHRAGVVHRDLKPANLYFAEAPERMRARRPEVLKILDFGIARADSFQARITHAGSIVGSLYYMSPEQARAEEHIDGRSDIWQVGAVLFRCLTGRRPFEGSAGSVLSRLAREDAPAPSRVNPELPRGLDPVFAKALARRAQDRYGAIEELYAAFKEAARQLSGTRPAVRPPPADADTTTVVKGRDVLPTLIGGDEYEEYASDRSSRSDHPAPSAGRPPSDPDSIDVDVDADAPPEPKPLTLPPPIDALPLSSAPPPRPSAPPLAPLLSMSDAPTAPAARSLPTPATLRPFYALERLPSDRPSPWRMSRPEGPGERDWLLIALVALTFLGVVASAVVAVVFG